MAYDSTTFDDLLVGEEGSTIRVNEQEFKQSFTTATAPAMQGSSSSSIRVPEDQEPREVDTTTINKIIGDGHVCGKLCKHNADWYPWCKGYTFTCRNSCCLGKGTHVEGEECICTMCATDIATMNTVYKKIQGFGFTYSERELRKDQDVENESQLFWVQMAYDATRSFLQSSNSFHLEEYEQWVEQNPIQSGMTMQTALKYVAIYTEAHHLNRFVDHSLYHPMFIQKRVFDIKQHKQKNVNNVQDI